MEAMAEGWVGGKEEGGEKEGEEGVQSDSTRRLCCRDRSSQCSRSSLQHGTSKTRGTVE